MHTFKCLANYRSFNCVNNYAVLQLFNVQLFRISLNLRLYTEVEIKPNILLLFRKTFSNFRKWLFSSSVCSFSCKIDKNYVITTKTFPTENLYKAQLQSCIYLLSPSIFHTEKKPKGVEINSSLGVMEGHKLITTCLLFLKELFSFESLLSPLSIVIFLCIIFFIGIQVKHVLLGIIICKNNSIILNVQ